MESAVYCKEAGKVQNIMTNKKNCKAQILKGKICFVGNRNEAIELLNSDFVVKKFMDSAEYIGQASAYKKKSITYFSYGDANDPSFMRKIDRCL